MDEKDIPQDNSRIFGGQRKVVYATREGRYVAAASSGWEVEEFATQQAADELARQTEAAWQLYCQGSVSPLYYLMFAFRHDETSLAAAAGVFRWQLRRHFKPQVFAALSGRVLAKYAAALCVDVGQLQQPSAPGELCLFERPDGGRDV